MKSVGKTNGGPRIGGGTHGLCLIFLMSTHIITVKVERNTTIIAMMTKYRRFTDLSLLSSSKQ